MLLDVVDIELVEMTRMWTKVHCDENSTVSSVINRIVGESSGSIIKRTI
jgi:hypothetical protein